jgi:hypothetical protein
VFQDTRGLNLNDMASIPLCKESGSRIYHTSVTAPRDIDEWGLYITEKVIRPRPLIDVTQRNCFVANPYLA